MTGGHQAIHALELDPLTRVDIKRSFMKRGLVRRVGLVAAEDLASLMSNL